MRKNAIQLSDHFDYKKLLRFTAPSIAMMIFTSIYGVVDGFFVSNYVGKTSFAAVNFIMPFLMILGSLGFMFGTGGSALVAKTMGEGKDKKANRIFSLLIYTAIIGGIIFAVLGFTFIRAIASLLGAEGELLDNCVTYGRIIIVAVPFFILQQAFQSFFITAEKPALGLVVTISAGVTNMVLDALLVAVFNLGLQGAATATAISQVIGGLIPLMYFIFNKTSRLRLTGTEFDGHALIRTCTNGSSELMSNISMSLVNMLYNVQLMKYAEEDGVSAFGVLMYVNLIFLAGFIGYSIGTAPVVGYHYGAGNTDELKGILKRSAVIISVFAVVMFTTAMCSSGLLAKIFFGYDEALCQLTRRAFSIFSFSFLFAGFAIYGSGFFTALNDGLTSALISFLRTLVFQVASVLILPLIWKIDGIWASMIVAEVMAATLSVTFIFLNRKKYNYL
ncbi:MAG: MATE family efflux transporter [Ruminococcus flavefaciens]|nr:MATE family efflux transporter [Ruminococcus flavefaciens]MCM1230304.1 MATE family efflux transporter [Ruminococcus flavefaciens]